MTTGHQLRTYLYLLIAVVLIAMAARPSMTLYQLIRDENTKPKALLQALFRGGKFGGSSMSRLSIACDSKKTKSSSSSNQQPKLAPWRMKLSTLEDDLEEMDRPSIGEQGPRARPRNKRKRQQQNDYLNHQHLFVFDDEAAYGMQAGGVRLSPDAVSRQDRMTQTLTDHLCQVNSDACKRELEVFHCQTCNQLPDVDGQWYSAVSHAGAVNGLFDASGKVKLLNVVPSTPSIRFSVVLWLPPPARGSSTAAMDAALRRSSVLLGKAVNALRYYHTDKSVDVQWIVTRYNEQDIPPEDTELALRTELAKSAALYSDVEKKLVNPAAVQFVKTNAVHSSVCTHQSAAQGTDNCFVAVLLDSDIELTNRFWHNAMALLQPTVSVYLPLPWSEYNPQSWQLVEQYQQEEKQELSRYDGHRGFWQEQAFGVLAMSGLDAVELLQVSKEWQQLVNAYSNQQTYAFHNYIQRLLEHYRLHVIRRKEKGTVQVWYGGDNEATVEERCRASGGAAFSACIRHWTERQGSELGLYLLALQQEDPKAFEQLAKAKQT